MAKDHGLPICELDGQGLLDEDTHVDVTKPLGY